MKHRWFEMKHRWFETKHSIRCGSAAEAASRDRVQIRLHDAADAADSREAGQIVCAAAVEAREIFQRFNGDVDADLVAELEAVGDGLRRAVDANSNSSNIVFLYAFAKARAGEMNESN